MRDYIPPGLKAVISPCLLCGEPSQYEPCDECVKRLTRRQKAKPEPTPDNMQDVITKTFLETWRSLNPAPHPSLSCDICGEKYFSRRMLNEHNENCIKPKPETSYGSYPKPLPLDFGLSGWIWRQLLRLIDWLNAITGSGKPKSKQTSEQMATLGELFEGHERAEVKPKPATSFGTLDGRGCYVDEDGNKHYGRIDMRGE